ncbi:SOS response-associated peptidase [Paenibacillus sp. PL91]|uniref:SOS response-associated peptidase n=1 Tax=Paenibacillus sp. PL91 TaxID=2729538 RepID=UPI00145D77A6|nr:SOS response-associated peptidase [Paenibacillus sp. PL91]MBC9205057.1 SOS response-associated peptidase [Paenibacillus sp. PL91]
MCGRYTISSELDEIINTFSVDISNFEYSKRYNVAPTQLVPGIINRDGKRVLEGFRWGLIPFWSKDPKIAYKMINARAEGIEKKPAFRSLIKRNRILIPSDGFYEWRQQEDGKQPYRFQLKSKGVYAFAGLYDTWEDPKGEVIQSCTIITTDPNELVSDVHNRMPVILTDTDAWLDRETEEVLRFLKTYPTDHMIKYIVSKDVGNVKNSNASLIDEVPLNSK